VQTIGNRKVLYVMEDADWHTDAAKEIPAGDLLIVADDAHRFDFLDRLLLLVRNLGQRQSVKLVLGARPSGSGSIDASLSIRFDVRQIERFPQLQRVGNQSVRDLALEVLGADHAQHAVALAAVSADTPLVTVVGGRLIARGEIPPALLANEDDFRHQVFDRFFAEYEKECGSVWYIYATYKPVLQEGLAVEFQSAQAHFFMFHYRSSSLHQAGKTAPLRGESLPLLVAFCMVLVGHLWGFR
jgi:hypothetical protein